MVVLVCSLSCTADTFQIGPHSLVVWNQSDFDLYDLRTHDSRDNYTEKENMLTSPLQGRDGQTGALSTDGAVFSIEDFYPGTFVTVFRRKIETQQDGPKITLTTGEGLALRSSGYTLVVFDQSFRLMFPNNAGNPFGAP